MKKKCCVCGSVIDITLPYNYEYVLHNNRWQHQKCLFAIRGRNNHLNWDSIYAKSEEAAKEVFYKCKMEDFIYNRYGMKFIPSSIMSRLDSVYKGKYNGLKNRIEPCDLYEAFVASERDLDINPKARVMRGGDRFAYELAIVLSKISNERVNEAYYEAEVRYNKHYSPSDLKDLKTPCKYADNDEDLSSVLAEM